MPRPREPEQAPVRRHRSFAPAAKPSVVRGPLGRKIAHDLAQYEQSSKLVLAHLTRPSVHKAVNKFGDFCFHNRVRLGLTRRDPDALRESLLRWFDESRFVNRLLRLGWTRKRQIEEALDCLVDGYDDTDVPKTLPQAPWAEPLRGRTAADVDHLALALTKRQAEGHAADAASLRSAAEVYRRQGHAKKARTTEKDAADSAREADRLRSAVRSMEASFGKKLDQVTKGAGRHWLTPILSDLEVILRDLPYRWELLAQLVREIEKKPSYTAEKVRSRVHEFRHRSRPRP